MSNIDYSKANSIGQLRIPDSISVIGCGGTGAWVSLFSAIAGVNHIDLYDDAVVTHTGLSRLPFTTSELGMPKVEALANLLRTFRPEIHIETYNRLFVMGEDNSSLKAIVFNCSDSANFAKELSDYATQTNIKHFFLIFNLSLNILKGFQ